MPLGHRASLSIMTAIADERFPVAPDGAGSLMLAPGLIVPLLTGAARLTRPVHSEARSRRWYAVAEDGSARYEILFLDSDEDPGPLLRPDADEGICGWEHERVSMTPFVALAFREDHLTPLAHLLRPGALATSTPTAERLAMVAALGELFEILHIVGEVLVAHGDLEAFAVHRSQGALQAVMRWPETLFPMAAPPPPGSFQSTGLDAPEVTGEIVRPVDERADVFMLGALSYALITGVRPATRQEAHTSRLPLLRAFAPDIPLGVERCVRRAMARTPEARYATVTDFVDAFKEALDQQATRALSGPDRHLSVIYAADTRIGRTKRAHHPVNQDTHLALHDPRAGWGLFAALDGVSHATLGSGELASWLARTTLEARWHRKQETPIYGRRFEGDTPFPTRLLETVVNEAHDEVFAWIERLWSLEEQAPRRDASSVASMATTLSAVGLFGDRMALCAVGDSPVYLIRFDESTPEGAQIERLNAAQTWALTQMRDDGDVTEALINPGAGWLDVAIGKATWETGAPQRAPLTMERWSTRLLPGDLILMSSDGIPDAFGSDAHRAILDTLWTALGGSQGRAPDVSGASRAALATAAQALVEAADDLGGHDNLTAILVAIGPPIDDKGAP